MACPGVASSRLFSRLINIAGGVTSLLCCLLLMLPLYSFYCCCFFKKKTPVCTKCNKRILLHPYFSAAATFVLSRGGTAGVGWPSTSLIPEGLGQLESQGKARPSWKYQLSV